MVYPVESPNPRILTIRIAEDVFSLTHLCLDGVLVSHHSRKTGMEIKGSRSFYSFDCPNDLETLRSFYGVSFSGPERVITLPDAPAHQVA